MNADDAIWIVHLGIGLAAIRVAAEQGTDVTLTAEQAKAIIKGLRTINPPPNTP